MADEKTHTDEQKIIIKKIVNDLSKQSHDFYYESTASIARMIHEYIQSDQINSHFKDDVAELSIEDIQILLSYNS